MSKHKRLHAELQHINGLTIISQQFSFAKSFLKFAVDSYICSPIEFIIHQEVSFFYHDLDIQDLRIIKKRKVTKNVRDSY